MSAPVQARGRLPVQARGRLPVQARGRLPVQARGRLLTFLLDCLLECLDILLGRSGRYR